MRLRSLFDVELPQADQLPDGAVLLYDRALGRWVARVLNTGGEVPPHTHPPVEITPQGSGSGLDADLLDGQHAAAFAAASHTHPDATASASGFMSAADKVKLDGIEAGAEVNQNAYQVVRVGSTDIAAAVPEDTLSLVAGSNITLTPDTANKAVTVAVNPAGLNADTVDGQHASAFAPASHQHALGVQLGFNTSSVTINQTTSTPVQITSVSLPAGSWIVVGVIQATAASTTSATLYGYLRSGTTKLRSFSVTANSNHGLLTVVLMLLRTVTSNETIDLAGATSSTTYRFTVRAYGGYLLAIKYNPVN